MGIREWDRKARQLQMDLKEAGSKYSPPKLREEYRLRAVQKTLVQMQQELEKKLALIHSMTSHRSFLSEKEKALLHWARSFSGRAREYYKEHAALLHDTFWARMASARSVSLVGSLKQNQGKPGSFHQVLTATKRRLESTAQSLKKRRLRLDQRYNYLAIVRANREASQPGDCYADLSRMSEEIGTTTVPGSSGPALEYIRTDILNQLELQPQDQPGTAAEGAAPPVTDLLQNSWEALKAFDYLNLDEETEMAGASGLIPDPDRSASAIPGAWARKP